jgi:pyrimidine operon attenuation protein/uracil phosphoribosyltransferase
MPHNIENKNIILIDDVLFTGRSIRSALDALVDYGRPRDIELLVLIDRKLHRHMPIQAKYVGKTIDSIDSEKVNVSLQNPIEESIVYLTQTNHPSQEP